jgi:hypothetical protein
MAIVRGIRKLLKSDFQEAPSWFDKLLSPFNQFLDSVIGALRNRLTFKDNFYCEVKELTFVHAIELEVAHNLSDFKGILIVRTPNETPSTTYGINEWHVREISNKTIGVTIEFAGAGSTSGTVTFIILG